MGKGQELRGGRMNTRNCNKALIAGAACEQDWRYGRCGQHRASQALLRSSSWEPDSFTVGKSLGDYLVKCPIWQMGQLRPRELIVNLATTNLPPDSMGLSGIFHINETIQCDLLCLAYFTKLNVFESPCFSMNQYFTLFLCLIFHNMYIPQSVYPFIHWWTLGLIPPFGYYE